MKELFRFGVIRPATRSEAATLALYRERSVIVSQIARIPTFPEQLQDAAATSEWAQLETVAFNYLVNHAALLLSQSFWSDLNSTLDQIHALPPELLAPDKWPLSKWPDPAAKMAGLFKTPADKATQADKAKIAALGDFSHDLADLFLALMIVRASGPVNLDSHIRAQKLWALVELLTSKPSLNELADVLRLIDLLLTGATAARTADDVQKALDKTLLIPPGIFSAFRKPVHSVGFIDLHVVKQHIRGYELGEIARIENILRGESRDHAQKHTLSNETDTFLQTETTTENDQELTSADHVDIKNEVDSVLKEDTKVNAGLNVQYDGGGSYKVQANLNVSYDRSSEESKKYASDVAKDVTQKAVKKVTQRVTQSQTTKIIETFEETEDQSFDNKNGKDHISGVYQWVEKVYLAQVFKYGWHMVFDIMVPEPGASLLAAANTPPPDQKKPVPPHPLGKILVDANGKPQLDSDGNLQLGEPLRPDQLVESPSEIMHDPATGQVILDAGGQVQRKDTSTQFYGDWTAMYRASGVEPAPPETITIAKSFSDQATDGNVHLHDVINLDDGYAAYTCSITVAWRNTPGKDGTGDDATKIDVMIGEKLFSWGKGYGPPNSFHDFTDKARNYVGWIQDQALSPDGAAVPLEERSIGVAVASVYSEEVAVNIEVRCKRTEGRIAKWQLQTYEKIAASWQGLQTEYEKKVADMQFQNKSTGPLGTADAAVNREIERTELKRACIAIIDNDNSTVGGISPNVAMQDWPPLPDPRPLVLPAPILPSTQNPNGLTTQELGSSVRWFEQAFEWQNIGYVFYPYFWGRREQWIRRLNLTHSDALFLQFLQAGYARVLLPVRSGFEDAMMFYLLTGRPWLGAELPSIGDKTQNSLYLDITEELKEQSGAPGDEIPSDEPPWEIRLPTTLIKLRKDDARPEWLRPKGYLSKEPDGPWTWNEGATSWDDTQ